MHLISRQSQDLVAKRKFFASGQNNANGVSCRVAARRSGRRRRRRARRDTRRAPRVLGAGQHRLPVRRGQSAAGTCRSARPPATAGWRAGRGRRRRRRSATRAPAKARAVTFRRLAFERARAWSSDQCANICDVGVCAWMGLGRDYCLGAIRVGSGTRGFGPGLAAGSSIRVMCLVV